MILENNQDNKTEEWISLEEASKLLNLSIKTLKTHCNNGKYTFTTKRK